MTAVSPGDPQPGGTAARPPQDEHAEDLPTRLAGLLARSARGEEDAFAALYDATSSRLHGLVLRVVRDPAQAEEVTQEAYLDIWRSSARFDPGRGSALSWMLAIAHRKAVDRVRSSEAASRRDMSYEATSRQTPFDQTAEQAERSLEAQRVRRAVDSLTETQRGAIRLAYLGGYTHTEVAQLLDVPLGTAKTRIRDGLIRLRDTMGMQS